MSVQVLNSILFMFDCSFLLCSVEECADSGPCDLNTDPLPTNTCVEMKCDTGFHVTRNSRYINGSFRGLKCDE